MAQVSRRAALRLALAAPLSTGAGLALLQACGKAEDSPKEDTPATEASCANVISDNHGHGCCIAGSVLDSPQPSNVIQLTMGTGHTHTVTLSAADIAAIKNNSATVTRTTSDDGHTHDVTWFA